MHHPTTHAGLAGDERRPPATVWSMLLPSLGAYALVVVALILIFHVSGAADYVGADNDDVMRLVEVRDLLAGQGWFDLMQYRLGLEGGTLMHWSRLVDLPIAALIRLFGLFVDTREEAEALALAVWPLFLGVLFMGAAGLGGRRIGGVEAMHIALGLSALFVFTSVRFSPGAIDHHNVQQVLLMFLAAMLVDRRRAGRSHAAAGVFAALAIAIGAETVPVVAVACGCVALQWAWHGEAFGRAARAFGLSLSVSISLLFVATVPPSAWRVVTCDNLSLGFYALSAFGGGGLFFIARFCGYRQLKGRMVALAGLGAFVGLSAVLIAPQCLGSPLAGLDPMLVELWLSKVTEARSILAQIRLVPETVGGFYAVGLFAIAVCAFRILDRERVEIHLVLLALIGAAFLVSLIQVRGAYLASALSILPLSAIITDLRRQSHAEPENMNAGFAYIITVLVSVPVVWFFLGLVSTKGIGNSITITALTQASAPAAGQAKTCVSRTDMRALSLLPPSVIAAPTESGATILRFTPHRVLAAPYHRNQSGMLTELHIGLSTPGEAEAFLRGAKVDVLAFCPTDPQTQSLMRLKPDGLYAQLSKGIVPPYLEPARVADPDGFRFFMLRRD
jgi:hypothetical protein